MGIYTAIRISISRLFCYDEEAKCDGFASPLIYHSQWKVGRMYQLREEKDGARVCNNS